MAGLCRDQEDLQTAEGRQTSKVHKTQASHIETLAILAMERLATGQTGSAYAWSRWLKAPTAACKGPELEHEDAQRLVEQVQRDLRVVHSL